MNLKCTRVIKSQNSIYSIAVSPDNQTIVSGHGDSTIKLSNLHTGELIHTFYVTPMADCCVAISSDGLNIACGDGRLNKGYVVKLWDLKNRQLIFTFNDHSKEISAVAFSPNTKLLASSSGDGTIKIWDYGSNWKNIFTGRLRRTISNLEWVTSIAFSPDGQILASSDYEQNIKLWNWRTGELLHIFHSQGSMIDSLCFSTNGKILINSSGYGKGKTEVWSLTDKKLIYRVPTYSLSVAISPDGQILALGTGNEDKTIVIYNLNKQQLIDELEGHSSGINCLAFTSDGSTLISGGRDSEIRIWKSLVKTSIQPNPKS